MRNEHSTTPHRLLETLDDLVRSDAAPARLDGSVVVAVKGPAGASYWHAAFAQDRLMGCGFLDGVPRDAAAILLLDAEQATDVADGEHPEGDVAMYGNRALLGAFVDRYCSFQSMVALRSGR